MIVLDEQISREDLREALAWYPGQVAFIQELRPATIIKDEAIPAILRQARRPTFVSINANDFWLRVPASRAYCIICLAVPDERIHTVPAMLQELLHRPCFRTKAQRMGKVVLVSGGHVRYYEYGRPQVSVLGYASSSRTAARRVPRRAPGTSVSHRV